MGDMLNDVATLLPILHDILEDVRKLTSGTITDIADNINKLIESNSDTLGRLLERVDTIAANVEGVTSTQAGDFKASIKDVRDITDSIKSLVDDAGADRGDGQQDARLDRSASEHSRQPRQVDEERRVDHRTCRQGRGTVGHILNDDTIARNVEDITENASGFIRSVTKLQTIVGLRTEYNILANTLKNYLSVQIMPRPDKFISSSSSRIRAATRTPSSRPRTARRTASSTPSRPPPPTRCCSRWFGKRIGSPNATLGSGSASSSRPAASAAIYLLDDKLELSADGVTRPASVKVTRGGSSWNRTVYLVGGADDLLNYHRGEAGTGGGFDWFLGLQLRFNDEDLKSPPLVGGGAAAGVASK